MLGIVLSHLCRHEEAAASIRRARELDPLSSMNRALSSQIAFAARDLPNAIHFAREAIVLDSALDSLDRASNAHDVHLAFLTVDPKWDALRTEPRFISVLERLGKT
jgi:hypothetical protein